MAILQPNTFSSYKLTEEEELSGNILTSLQVMVIQNQIALLAEQKLALIYDPSEPQSYGIQIAFLSGKLEILQQLLSNSVEANETVVSNAASNQ
jgi:hypothetical protein